MKQIPTLDPEQSPLMVLDLIYSSSIRDVMNGEVVTASRDTSMRDIQQLMRDNGITGVPIAEAGRLFGIVSIDDIIRALDTDQIDQPASTHMSTNVVTLEAEMPLSIALSFFNKYHYGRFPVLDAKNHLCGILTTRDINLTLIESLMQEVNRLESEVVSEERPEGLELARVYHTRQHDFERGGKASTEIKQHLVAHGIQRKVIKKVAIASYELEINQVAHSLGGTMSYHVYPDRVEILAQDRGPGIPDVDQAMESGYTTASEWIKSLGFGAGLGLPNVQRVSDEFFIHSTIDIGTTVKSVVFLHPTPPEEQA